jgi:hypothetical protein
MIRIAVSDQRAFTLPADLVTTTAYFRDFERTIQGLPHLIMIKTYAPDQYRILYSAAEAGVYLVKFYCDIQVQFDELNHDLRVLPLPGIPPVPPKVTLNSMTGQGYYASQSIFQPAGKNTNVNYEVEIKAEVPKRLELRFLPDHAVKRVIEQLVKQRLQAITDTYFERTIDGLRMKSSIM